MEVCAACDVHVVRHVSVEVVIHRFCNTCFKSVKKDEQDEDDNGDLGANVATEVRNKSHRKNKKKRA